MKTCYEHNYLFYKWENPFAIEATTSGRKTSINIEQGVKRIFDLIGSLIGLIFTMPLFVIIYALIRFSDNFNPIYSQERIGLHGRAFNIYKFRSMRPDAESQGTPILCIGENDNRLTPIGRFIRAHHLDELPQLWNVLKGDMSFVGYRPERKFYINQIRAIAPEYDRLYSMRPGLFSYATLYNGYTDTMAKMLTRLKMDLDYLHNHSLFTDIKIIWLTTLSIIFGKKF